MRLRLKYPPQPENAAKFAADIAAAAAEISGADLDYSVASLETVDGILEGMRRDGVSSDQVAETLFGFGCYVGEVFVRQAGGAWCETAASPMAQAAGFPLVIDLGEGRYCNPIGKVFKRIDNGEEDYLPYFFQVFTKKED